MAEQSPISPQHTHTEQPQAVAPMMSALFSPPPVRAPGVFGQNRIRLDALASHPQRVEHNPESCSNFTIAFCAINCITGFGSLMDWLSRTAIRKRYNIAGSEATDILLTCYCLPCSQQQQARELSLEEQQVAQRDAPGGSVAKY
ncbi:Cys-rich family protein [Pseudohyphozyma bogoriensis]|nr:Cys-rich family protein [Pseudohyphozyma bogoriensis]